jgi:phage gpG-like protein
MSSGWFLAADVNGTKALFVTMQSRAGNMRPVWDEIADDYARFQKARWSSHGVSAGSAWPPLAASTVAHKRRSGGTMMVESGDLRKSLTQRPFGLELITDQELVIGTNVRYAGYHQTGTRRMPAREVIGIPRPVQELWSRRLMKHIISGRNV